MNSAWTTPPPPSGGTAPSSALAAWPAPVSSARIRATRRRANRGRDRCVTGAARPDSPAPLRRTAPPRLRDCHLHATACASGAAQYLRSRALQHTVQHPRAAVKAACQLNEQMRRAVAEPMDAVSQLRSDEHGARRARMHLACRCSKWSSTAWTFRLGRTRPRRTLAGRPASPWEAAM